MNKFLFLSYLLMAVIIGFTTTLNIEQQLKREILDRAELTVRDTTSQTVMKLDYSIDRRTEEMENLSYLKEIITNDNDHILTLLNLLKQVNPNYVWLSYNNTNGIISQATSSFAIGMDIHDKEWFKHAIQGYEYLTNVHEPVLLQKYYPDKYNNMKVMNISLPVKNDSGKVIAVLSSGINLYWLQDILDRLDDTVTDEHLKLVITTDDGLVLAATEKELINTTIKLDELKFDFDGSENFVNILPIKHATLNWQVATYTSKHIAYGAIDKAHDNILKLSLIYFIVSMLLSYYFAYKFLKPMKRLAINVAKIEANLDERLPEMHSYAELNVLTAAINDLLDKIKQTKLDAKYFENSLIQTMKDNKIDD